MNYKFNTGTINFHQFLFLLIDRLRETSHLISSTNVLSYLNNYGFFTSENYKSSFYSQFKIDPAGYVNYVLVTQQFMEFYTRNMQLIIKGSYDYF